MEQRAGVQIRIFNCQRRHYHIFCDFVNLPFSTYNPDMTLFSAQSFSLSLPHASTPQAVLVLSRHQRVINFLTTDDEILAVVHPEVGNGPFHVVLARPVDFSAISPQARGMWQGQRLQVGDAVIDWARARGWNPHLAPRAISAPSLVVLQECAHRSNAFEERWAGMDSHAVARMQRGGALLRTGIVDADAASLNQGLQLLVGLGPGLTPAGDDYVLGALARCQIDPSLPGRELLQARIPYFAPKTTRLSRAWLLYATHGQFDERWHALQHALAQDDARLINRACEAILRVGASSGPQALAGFLLI